MRVYIPSTLTYGVQLNLDGAIEVTHPDLTVQNYPLNRLTKLYDGIEQLEDMWDDASEGHDSYDDSEGPVWTMDEDGVWQPETGSGDEWEEYEEDEDQGDEEGDLFAMQVDSPGWGDDPMAPLDIVPRLSPPSSAPESNSRSDTPRAEILTSPSPLPSLAVDRLPSPDVPKDADETALDDLSSDDPELPWKRFDILSSAPVDHAYYSSPPAQPSRAFLTRLAREYRVLSSSLPGMTPVHVPLHLCSYFCRIHYRSRIRRQGRSYAVCHHRPSKYAI